MKVTILEQSSRKNLDYIEDTIKLYIKKNNFPKNLVISKLQNDIEKGKKLEKELNDKLNKLNENVKMLNKTKTKIKKENEEKTKKLLNNFSSSIF